MAVEKIGPADKSIAALLNKAQSEPLILQTESAGDFAVLPLDDEVLDLLLERSPTLREECRQIRERMRQGKFLTHEQMVQALEKSAQA
jgi:hypothetical protein